MRAEAIKKGQLREKATMPIPTAMGTLRCDICGEQFIIYHDFASLDRITAVR
jgi:hypothetical protein